MLDHIREQNLKHNQQNRAMAQCGYSVQASHVGAVVFMPVTLSSNFLFHIRHKEGKKNCYKCLYVDPSNNVPLRQVSLLLAILATPLCSIYAAHLSIIQPTLSKTERWVKEGEQV